MVICFVTVGDFLLLDLLCQLTVSELVRLHPGRWILLEDSAHVTKQFCHALHRTWYPWIAPVIISCGGVFTFGRSVLCLLFAFG